MEKVEEQKTEETDVGTRGGRHTGRLACVVR